MKKNCYLKVLQIFKIILLSVVIPTITIDLSTAQVKPDNTLGTENSAVHFIDELRNRIEGGAIRGENLFHSFEEFSIREGLEVYFANPEQISNIFSRITGNNVSEIFGTLGVEGAANLFLINPNGIIFGENTVIDIGGSFIATTAETIEFEDGTVLKIRDRSSQPLLTWNAPIGLGLAETSGEITIKNSGHTLEDDFGGSFTRVEGNNGLEVQPGRTIALFGREVSFQGGILTAFSGKIEIASINKGIINFDIPNANRESWNFEYQNANVFGDIHFANRSLLNVSSIPSNFQSSGGAIKIVGRRIFSKDGSVFLNQNFGEADSGSIQVDATESFKISGTDPISGVQGGIRTENLSGGDGGDIVISAPNFTAFDGASVAAISYSPFLEASSGNIIFNTSNLQIRGFSPLSAFSISNVATFSFNISKAGRIEINSNTLTITNGGILGSSGFFGAVGEIKINSTEYVKIEGFQPTLLVSSGIASTNSFSNDPGQINIFTKNLSIENGANLSTSTFGSGPAGDINITTDNIFITGRIANSENLIFETSSNISSSASLINNLLLAQLPLLEIVDNISLEGNSGNINIESKNITISDRAIITVQNKGIGDGGTIKISANSIDLKSGGEITATALSGRGGNIEIISDRLILEDADISSFSQGEGNGGNIDIDTNGLIGINSNITATAIEGDGGNITIKATGLLGFENNSLKIDASSKFGQDGTIDIVNPQLNNRDPIVEFTALEISTDKNNLENRCENALSNRTIIYTGRTGFTLSTQNPSRKETYFPMPDFVPPEEETKANKNTVWTEGDPIVDSNTVRVDENGEVYLVAKLSQKTAEELLCQ